MSDIAQNQLEQLERWIYAPLTVPLGAVTGSRRLERVGMALCGFIVGLFADISRRKPVPGANDNASCHSAPRLGPGPGQGPAWPHSCPLAVHRFRGELIEAARQAKPGPLRYWPFVG